MSAAIWSIVLDIGKPLLTTHQKIVLLVLASYADNAGRSIFPSVQTLARRCLMTRRGVQKALRALEDAGFVVTVGRAAGHGTVRRRLDVQRLLSARDESTGGNTVHPSEVNVVRLRGEYGSPNTSGDPSEKKRQSYVRRDERIDLPTAVGISNRR